MNIVYKETKIFAPKELEGLFLSVEWASGHYPERLVVAMKNSGSVFSAWNNEQLIGLINVLDDGIMTAYVHYLLVHPQHQGKGIGRELVRLVSEKYKDYLRIVLVAYNKGVDFYTSCGFTAGIEKTPMFLTSI